MRLISMDFKKWTKGVLLLLLWSCESTPTPAVSLSGTALGTTYNIQYVNAELPRTQAQQSIDSLFRVLNQSLSTYLPNADISKINAGDSTLVVDVHFQKVYHKAAAVWQASDGYFDPTVGALVNAYGFGPGKKLQEVSAQQRDSILEFTGWDKTELTERNTIRKATPSVYFDFNALAKGYAVDVIGDFFRAKKSTDFLVEIGGEIVAQGKSPKSNSFWKVAIDDPQQGGERQFAQVLSLENQALATSGNYRKYFVHPTTGQRWVHSIDPKTGNAFPSNILSASVLAPDCMTADAYATALMVMPLEKSKALIEQNPDLEAYWIVADSLGGVEEVFSKGFLKN